MGTVTISSVTYNIYGTSTLAGEYLAAGSHTNVAWAAATTDNKNRALVTAARFLDRQDWQGTKVDDAQALAWPREGVEDRNGDEVDDSEIPADIILASYELAYLMLTKPTVQDTPDQSANIASLTAGPVGVSYFRPTAGSRFPTIVDELLGQYLATGGAGLGALSYAGGTDVESDFDSADRYDILRGY